ncbi:hypothetical protein KC19_11G074000 [Ceratodon purpureus]|uniref:Cytochrome P450 n=1 Tax=Ceratodon purpureus TaxID=3225 RepID=A0A8T0GC84_CERPU|nr:hypothetical protein KC19_11G074000 [Ceratodon purpureus]
METHVMSALVAAACVVPILLVLRKLYQLKCNGSRKLPPSPPSWPIIGHLHLLGALPHRSFAQLSQQCGPLMLLRLGSKPALVVTSSEMARELFKNHDMVFSHRPHYTVVDLLGTPKQGMAFQSNTPFWRHLRKIFMTEMRSTKRLQQARKFRATELSCMLKTLLTDSMATPDDPVVINRRVHQMTLNFTSKMIMGKRYFKPDSVVDDAEAKEFKYLSDEMDVLYGSFFLEDYIPLFKWLDLGGLKKRTRALTSRFQKMLTAILDEHRERRNGSAGANVDDLDLVDALLSLAEKDDMDYTITEGNIRGVTWEAFMGGTGSSTALTEWAMAHLVQAPAAMASLQSELDLFVGRNRTVSESDIPNLKYLQAVIKETFRLHPPAPLLVTHENHEPCLLAGYYVPANTRLHVDVWAIGRDPCVWKDPEEFNPGRFMEGPLQEVDVSGKFYELMPFGSGRRVCPAQPLGLMNVQMLVASLVQAFDCSLPEKLRESYSGVLERAGLVSHMAKPLQVFLKPRLPLELYEY